MTRDWKVVAKTAGIILVLGTSGCSILSRWYVHPLQKGLVLTVRSVLDGSLVFGTESLAEAFKRRSGSQPVLACFGYFLIGSVLGGVSVLLIPRFSEGVLVSAGCLLAAPSIAGLAMHAFGVLRQRSGAHTTNLATFAGGASFAFGISLVRFLILVTFV